MSKDRDRQRGASELGGGAMPPPSRHKLVEQMYAHMCNHFGAERICHEDARQGLLELPSDVFDKLAKEIQTKKLQGKADAVRNKLKTIGKDPLRDKSASSGERKVEPHIRPVDKRLVEKSSPPAPKTLNTRIRTLARIVNTSTNEVLNHLTDAIIVSGGLTTGYTFMSMTELSVILGSIILSDTALAVFVQDDFGTIDTSFARFNPTNHTLPIIVEGGNIQYRKYIMLQLGKQNAGIMNVGSDVKLEVVPMTEVVFVVRTSIVCTEMWNTFANNVRRNFESFFKEHIPSKLIVDGQFRSKTMQSDGRNDIPKGEAFEFRAYFRVLDSHVSNIFAFSGLQDVVILRANSKEDTTRIIPLDSDMSAKEAMKFAQDKLQNKYMGVVPYKSFWAARVQSAQYVDAKIAIDPHTLTYEQISNPNMTVKFKYVISGLDRNLSVKSVVSYFNTLGWHIVPLEPPRLGSGQFQTLVVGCDKAPLNDTASINGNLVVMRPFIDKKGMEQAKKAEAMRAKLHEAIAIGDQKKSYAQVVNNLKVSNMAQHFDMNSGVNGTSMDCDSFLGAPLGDTAAFASTGDGSTQASVPTHTPAVSPPPPQPAVPAAEAIQSAVVETVRQDILARDDSFRQDLAARDGVIDDLKTQLIEFKNQMEQQNHDFSSKLEKIQLDLREEFKCHMKHVLGLVSEKNEVMTKNFTQICQDQGEANKRDLLKAIASLRRAEGESSPEQEPDATTKKARQE